MKTLSIFALAAVCLIMTGCEKDETNPLTLDRTTVNATLINETYKIIVSGGSSNYEVSTDNPQIADIRIGTDNVVEIETKQAGEAVITVTDKRSGKEVKCALTVKAAVTGFEIVSMQYAVDVDDANARTAIEEELKIPPYPIGSIFEWISPIERGGHDYLWVVKTAAGTVITSGAVTQERLESGERIYFPAYQLLKIEGGVQKYYMRIFNIDFGGGKELVYYMYNVERRADTRLNSNFKFTHDRFYEDLTDHYKSLYPDAGVNGVVRVQQCNHY